MTKRRLERDDRMRSIERTLQGIERNVDRIELATVVREPSSAVAVDAYEGLRRQVIAAVGERTAHLHQLAQFDAALRAGATTAELAALVREWMGQASLGVVEDPSVEGAFEVVGDGGGPVVSVIRPAYVDTVTGRVVRAGVLACAEAPAPEGSPA